MIILLTFDMFYNFSVLLFWFIGQLYIVITESIDTASLVKVNYISNCFLHRPSLTVLQHQFSCTLV